MVPECGGFAALGYRFQGQRPRRFGSRNWCAARLSQARMRDVIVSKAPKMSQQHDSGESCVRW